MEALDDIMEDHRDKDRDKDNEIMPLLYIYSKLKLKLMMTSQLYRVLQVELRIIMTSLGSFNDKLQVLELSCTPN